MEKATKIILGRVTTLHTAPARIKDRERRREIEKFAPGFSFFSFLYRR